ncbi:MAG: sulfatase/phosphatase domain-containing protein, partial [Verrucomicrobiota bacterium]
RTERYTLAHFYPVNEWELFDLEKDPQQMRSVYDDSAYAKTVTELKTELDRLRKEFKDTSDSAEAGQANDAQPARTKKGKKGKAKAGNQ